MMTHYIVRLRFNTPFRFGADSSGIGIEDAQPFVHSDTLFSALCNAWSKFRILNSEELSEIGEKILLSSTSFYSKNFKGKPTYFLPKPKMPCVWLSKQQGENKKKLDKILKKANWITATMFQHWLNPEPPKNVFNDKPEKLSESLAYSSLYKEYVVAKHSQDRLTSASNLFYETQYEFRHADSGLFFFVSLSDEQLAYKFNQGLKALSQTGLGGERNFGLGRFEVSVESKLGVLSPIQEDGTNLEFVFNDEPKFPRCLLSLSLPTELETVALQKATESQLLYYDITLRKGWAFSSVNLYQMKRQTLRMLSEGSVFENGLCPQGSVIDVKPLDSKKQQDFPHPVYRYGKSFTVPIKIY